MRYRENALAICICSVIAGAFMMMSCLLESWFGIACSLWSCFSIASIINTRDVMLSLMERRPSYEQMHGRTKRKGQQIRPSDIYLGSVGKVRKL